VLLTEFEKICRSCNQDVREVSGLYNLLVAGEIDNLSDGAISDFIVDSFNSLRVDVCSSQVTDVVIQDDPLSLSTRQSGTLNVEVVSLSQRPKEVGAFFESDGFSTANFLSKMNELISDSGVNAAVSGVEFVGPAVQCSDIRSTRTVNFEIEYSTSFPFPCPEEDDDDRFGGDDDDAVEVVDDFVPLDDDYEEVVGEGTQLFAGTQ